MNSIEVLLEIESRLIADYERHALDVLAQIWERQGRPTEKLKLISVLRQTLDQCDRYGYQYPAVLILRKGQLTRDEWQPRQIEPTRRTWTPPPGVCPRCGGTGVIVHRGGASGTLCDCRAGRPAKESKGFSARDLDPSRKASRAGVLK